MMLHLVRREEEGWAGKREAPAFPGEGAAGMQAQSHKGEGEQGVQGADSKLGVQARREGSRGGAPGGESVGSLFSPAPQDLPPSSLLTRSKGKSR